MSYNIDHIEPLGPLDLSIMAKDVVRLLRKYRDDMPESTFLDDLEDMALEALESDDPKRLLKLKHFWWSGECSGHAYEFLQETVAPLLHGRAELVFTWEGGDSVSGLIVDNGDVIECDVVQKLVPKGAKP
jgi:hypothetical protein